MITIFTIVFFVRWFFNVKNIAFQKINCKTRQKFLRNFVEKTEKKSFCVNASSSNVMNAFTKHKHANNFVFFSKKKFQIQNFINFSASFAFWKAMTWLLLLLFWFSNVVQIIASTKTRRNFVVATTISWLLLWNYRSWIFKQQTFFRFFFSSSIIFKFSA